MNYQIVMKQMTHLPATHEDPDCRSDWSSHLLRIPSGEMKTRHSQNLQLSVI